MCKKIRFTKIRNTTVAKNEEYRVLAYDLTDGEYKYIEQWEKDQRHLPLYGGEQVNIRRFMLYRGFVFPKKTKYPPGSSDWDKPFGFGESHAIESRPLPACWDIGMPLVFKHKHQAIYEAVLSEKRKKGNWDDDYDMYHRSKKSPDDLEYMI